MRIAQGLRDDPWFDPFQVKLLGAADGLAQAAAEAQWCREDRLPIRLHSKVFGGLLVDEVYLYRRDSGVPIVQAQGGSWLSRRLRSRYTAEAYRGRHGEDRLMKTVAALDLSALYERDETAWLEAMSALAADGRCAEMDYPHLSEYLADMAKRDRREVFSRLVVLLTHLLKWEYQPQRRSGSWRGTTLEQQRELRQLLESGTLRNHAAAVFTDAYVDARKQAAAETGLARAAFPEECPWDLDGALADRGEDAEPLREPEG